MESSLQHIERFVEQLPVGIVVLDSDGVMRTSNALALDLLGIAIEDMLGQSFGEAVGSGELSAAVQRVQAGNAHSANFFLDKSNRHIKCSVSALGPEDGPGVIIVCEDASGFKQMELVKQEFLQTILHGLRSPLSTLKTSLSILRTGKIAALPESAREIIDMSSHEVNRLNALLIDLRNLFYIETGLAEKELEIESFPARKVINRAIEDLSKSGAGYDGLAARVRISASKDVTMHADYDKTKQVLEHILRNAYAFSPAKAPIAVGVSETDAAVAVTIADTGIGIAAGQQKFLFTKFFREDNDITRAVPGNGLGLFISRSLLELMNGSVYAESEQGKGTIITINLPAAQE